MSRAVLRFGKANAMARLTLWRLNTEEPARLEVALERVIAPYLAHSPLTAVLVRLGDATRAYLILHSCDGCKSGRCVPGCRADLLRRALRAERLGELVPVPSGLAKRPYRRLAYAVPRKRAAVLTADLLARWPEARLVIQWRRAGSSGVACAAQLLVSAVGPSPAAALRAQGWWALPVLRTLWRRSTAPAPLPFPLRSPWGKPPFLPLPSQASETTTLPATIEPLTIDALLTEWLTTALEAPAAFLAEHSTAQQVSSTEETSDWPVGPGALSPSILATLVPQLLAEPSFRCERAGQSGITKGRLASLKHAKITEPTARALMVWFERAGVLAPAASGGGPWRAPRTFVTDDVAQIAERLRATPLPSESDVRAAYGGD
jgi:hypothetical protein